MESLEMNLPETLQRTFQGRRVLITGHTGFKGSWLALWLTKLGAKVMGYSLPPPTQPSLFEICSLQDNLLSVTGDIRDFETLKNTLLTWEPEVVFHLAAQSLVRQSYRDPLETYHTNVMGTVNTLEACRQAPSVKTIINVTSDKCYEPRPGSKGYCETDPLGGDDPYSSSKACAELVTQAYLRSFLSPENHAHQEKSLASVRAGNVIGGGDWGADRLVPDCVRAFTDRQPVLIRYPEAVRPWQHVLEPLCGYMLLARDLMENQGVRAGAWNFGPDEDSFRPVGWMVQRMVTLWGNGASWQADDETHPRETLQLKLDSSKARSLLDWSPRWSLESALEKTIEWYKSYYNGKPMIPITIHHIEAYEESLEGRTPS
jgi:CDP-glucose 4,6-dehydratase